MLKILIVDDEAFFRTSFTSYIDWASLDCEVVGTAEDGQQALRAAEELHPDLVFLDIQMPVLDGLAVLEQIHEKYPKIRVIMLTGFNDFASVRQALRAGAVDYIHKVELGEQNIAGVIEKQRQQLKSLSERQSGQDAGRADLRLMLAEWMYRGGALPFPGEAELRAFLELSGGQLYVMQFSLKNIAAIRDRYAGKESLLYQGIENMLREMLPRAQRPFPLFFESGAFSLIGGLPPHTSSGVCGRELAYVREKVSGGLRRFFNVEAVACVSALHASALDLPQMAQEAQTASVLAFSGRGDGLFEYHQLAKKRIAEYLDTQRARDEIESVLRCSDHARCRQILEALFLPDGETLYTPNAVRMAAQSIVYAFCPEEFRTFWQAQIVRAEHQEKITALLEEFLCEHARRIYPYSDLTANAMIYIEQNYSEHTLSLNQIAEAVNANASYLSRLFRQEAGYTVTDQINRVRVRAAKQLLRDKRWTVYRVAQEVGYGNTEYFNRIFKKIAGCSPGAYRAQGERQEGE